MDDQAAFADAPQRRGGSRVAARARACAPIHFIEEKTMWIAIRIASLLLVAVLPAESHAHH